MFNKSNRLLIESKITSNRRIQRLSGFSLRPIPWKEQLDAYLKATKAASASIVGSGLLQSLLRRSFQVGNDLRLRTVGLHKIVAQFFIEPWIALGPTPADTADSRSEELKWRRTE